MKSSVLIVALGALLAAASPVNVRGSARSAKRGTACAPKPVQPVAMKHAVPAVAPHPAVSSHPAVSTPAAPAVSAPAAQPVADPDYTQIILDHHNDHRKNHSSPALVWDNTLAQYAETIAKTCVFKHDMNQGQGHYGQNLAAFGSTADNLSSMKLQVAADSVTNSWYNDEMENYPSDAYGQPNPPASLSLDAYGHFTQVVWKSTTRVGCYSAMCAAGTIFQFPGWFTVCNYGGPGNVGGQYGQNVLPPLGLPMLKASS